jgi:ABC-type ATPase with predicted acetyltransferase domain
VTDDRVPGTPIPRVRAYTCPACGKVIRDEKQPECPDDGTLMEP